jgi:hypothetical protein
MTKNLIINVDRIMFKVHLESDLSQTLHKCSIVAIILSLVKSI